MESDTRSFLGSESVVGQTSEVDRFPKLLVDGFFEGWELWFVWKDKFWPFLGMLQQIDT